MMRVKNAFTLSWNDCSKAPYIAKVQLEKLTEIIVKAEKDIKNCKAQIERWCTSRSTVPWVRWCWTWRSGRAVVRLHIINWTRWRGCRRLRRTRPQGRMINLNEYFEMRIRNDPVHTVRRRMQRLTSWCWSSGPPLLRLTRSCPGGCVSLARGTGQRQHDYYFMFNFSAGALDGSVFISRSFIAFGLELGIIIFRTVMKEFLYFINSKVICCFRSYDY